MKIDKERILTIGATLICLWIISGTTAFAVEDPNLIALTAAAIPQTGGLNAIVYASVGVALAGFGFMVRKKI